MSGSPKYTSVSLSYERRQREAAALARRAEERRRRQAEREARFRALEEQRARQRLARQAEQLDRMLDDSRRAVIGHVASVGAVVAEVQRDVAVAGVIALTDQMRALQEELSALESKVRSTAGGAPSDFGSYERQAESFRARALSLRAGAFRAAGNAGRQLVVADLRGRLGTLESAVGLDAAQLTRCRDVLARLESAASQEEGIRFEALHGTAEHAVASLERKVADAREKAARRASDADQLRAAKDAAAAAERLDYAAARLAVLADSAQSATADADAFGERALADALRGAIAAAQAALSAGGADEAMAEIGRLEGLLPQAEAQLDEAAAAYERRSDLAVALQGLLTDRGMALASGRDEDGSIVLRFERPGGAAYTATIGDDAHGDLSLAYAIEGEPDVPVLVGAPGAAVCDQTEAFLEAVHADLADSGFDAGELRWNGKPPRGQARTLPRHRVRPDPTQAARWRQHG